MGTMGAKPSPESPRPCNHITHEEAGEVGSIVMRSKDFIDMYFAYSKNI
jgi:hypothetical protein